MVGIAGQHRQKSSICEPSYSKEKTRSEGKKLRPGLLRKRCDSLDRSAQKRLTYRRFLSTRVVFREERIALTCLSPIKKAKQPPPSFPSAPSARSFVRALVPACSYVPAPVSHPRVFGLPPARDSLLRFFVRISALAPSPRVLGSSRPRSAYGSFGLPQNSPLCHVPAPFRTLAISAPSSQLSFPLPRLPRVRFLGPPFHIPRSCVPRPLLRRPL